MVGEFIVYLLKILLYTVGGLIACGFFTYFMNDMYNILILNSLGRKFLVFTAYIGTPIHELGHAIMCIIFNHKITDMKFYSNGDSRTLGYVRHSYIKSDFYQQVGNFFIGLGPIFSGFTVISLILYFCFKEQVIQYYNMCITLINSNANILDILLNNLNLLKLLLFSDTNIAIKIISGVVVLSVSLHIHLSPADIKGSITGFGYYFVISLLFALITFYIGGGLKMGVLFCLEYFFIVSCAIYSLVITFAFLNLLIGILVFILYKFFGK